MYIVVIFRKNTRQALGINGKVSKDCEVYEFETSSQRDQFYYDVMDSIQSKGMFISRYDMR